MRHGRKHVVGNQRSPYNGLIVYFTAELRHLIYISHVFYVLFLFYLYFLFAGYCQNLDGLIPTANLDSPTVVPKFVSRGHLYKAVVGDTIELPCKVQNLGKHRRQTTDDRMKDIQHTFFHLIKYLSLSFLLSTNSFILGTSTKPHTPYPKPLSPYLPPSPPYYERKMFYICTL